MFQLETDYFAQYTVIGVYGMFAIGIACLLAALSVVLRFSPVPVDLSVASSYECGFLPFDKARTKFEVNFFVVGLLFVVFDLEVIFILPWSTCVGSLGLGSYLVMALFLFILGVGFVYEIGVKALDY